MGEGEEVGRELFWGGTVQREEEKGWRVEKRLEDGGWHVGSGGQCKGAADQREQQQRQQQQEAIHHTQSSMEVLGCMSMKDDLHTRYKNVAKKAEAEIRKRDGTGNERGHYRGTYAIRAKGKATRERHVLSHRVNDTM